MPKVIQLHSCYARGCRTQGRTLFCDRHWAIIPTVLKVKLHERNYPTRRPPAARIRVMMTAVAVIAIREATDELVTKFSED
jgi:hypothetical protein